MILSHALGLIFLKTKKVGGTSFEIALSKFCGDDDIITPISLDDEKVRLELGFRGAQNHLQKTRRGYRVAGHPNEAVSGDFKNHIHAADVHRQIGDRLFSHYTKISIHRDPLDFLISQYFWRINKATGADRIAFGEWVEANRENVLENYAIAPIKGAYACDRIIRYENLAEDISMISELPENFLTIFQSLSAKGDTRDDASRDTRQFFREHGVESQIEEIYDLIRNVA